MIHIKYDTNIVVVARISRKSFMPYDEIIYFTIQNRNWNQKMHDGYLGSTALCGLRNWCWLSTEHWTYTLNVEPHHESWTRFTIHNYAIAWCIIQKCLFFMVFYSAKFYVKTQTKLSRNQAWTSFKFQQEYSKNIGIELFREPIFLFSRTKFSNF